MHSVTSTDYLYLSAVVQRTRPAALLHKTGSRPLPARSASFRSHEPHIPGNGHHAVVEGCDRLECAFGKVDRVVGSERSASVHRGINPMTINSLASGAHIGNGDSHRLAIYLSVDPQSSHSLFVLVIATCRPQYSLSTPKFGHQCWSIAPIKSLSEWTIPHAPALPSW